MARLKDSPYFNEAIHEINYPFGDFFLFDGFVIAEIRKGVTFTWDNHGKRVTEDIAYLYDSNGKDIVFISNRINTYSVKPTDWLKFIKNRYLLRAHVVVSYTTIGNSIALVERFFTNTKFKRFRSLTNAVDWAKGLSEQRLVS